LEQAFKLRNILRGKRTRIAFIIHDEVVLDVAQEDKNELSKLKKAFETTRFGKFPVNSKIA